MKETQKPGLPSIAVSFPDDPWALGASGAEDERLREGYVEHLPTCDCPPPHADCPHPPAPLEGCGDV